MPTSVENSIRVIWSLMVRVVIIAASVYLLYRLRSIVISILIAIFLAYALLPAVEWMCKRRIGGIKPKTQRLIATIIVFLAFLAFVAGSITLITAPFTQEVNQFSKNLKSYSSDIQKLLEQGAAWYAKAVPADVKGVIGKLDWSKVTGWIAEQAQRLLNATKSSIGILMELILIPVLAFYFVLDYRMLSREAYGIVPAGNKRRAVMRIGRGTGEILQSYVVGQFILCLIAGVLTGLFLWAMGMPYVVVLALFAGITRAIPVIGPVVSGIPIILVGVLNSQGWAVPTYLLLFVTVMHFAESKFIMPRLIGDRMRLHPAVVIIALLIGAELFGVLGMFIAAPVAAVVRDLLRLYYIAPKRRHAQREVVETCR